MTCAVTYWTSSATRRPGVFTVDEPGFIKKGVRSAAFSPDGRVIATAGAEGKVKLWEVATGQELRKWYGHEPARFAEFAERYRAELAEPERAEALGRLRGYAEAGPLTLLTAAVEGLFGDDLVDKMNMFVVVVDKVSEQPVIGAAHDLTVDAGDQVEAGVPGAVRCQLDME